jgi:site-specific DNA-cytosine methylase
MLIGAKKAEFKVVGNIDWRNYYHTGTFEHNFKKGFMIKRLGDLTKEQVEDLKGVDLIMGHTECGNFSQLNAKVNDDCGNPGDIPEFVEAIRKLKPRFFAMDNLPKSLIAFTALMWRKELKDYDIFFEWISNYNYGNIQKFRKRLFVIGARKEEKFVFVPGETENSSTVWDMIGDIPKDALNHKRKKPSDRTHISNIVKGRPLTVKEAQEEFKKVRPGECLSYKGKDGTMKKKIGIRVTLKDSHGFVLDGGECSFHPVNRMPLTCRERARIQGCPDDFEFILTEGQECGSKMIKQTGKFMPVQFCEYISKQIAAHIKGKKFKASGKRLLPSNSYIDEAKMEFCKGAKGGYSEQEKACLWCSSFEECTLKRRIE